MIALQDLLLPMMSFEKFRDMDRYKNSPKDSRMDRNHMAPALIGEEIQPVREYGRPRVR